MEEFMKNFWTEDPVVAQYLFAALVITFTWSVMFLIDWLAERASERKFEKDKERFWKEVAEGKEPDWVPVRVFQDGRRYTDPDCLAHSMTFRNEIRATSEFFERNKNEKGEVEIDY